ncbi:ELMO domain-containing protein 3 [Armadillidium vulgare]|nr:ELMO domain-containing protein 3 [Armadillidium vulgare]
MRVSEPTIKPTLERKGVNGLIRSIFGPKKLKEELIPERNLLFAIAQCPLDNNEPLHLQILLTVYKVLTGTRLDCPRYGNHWDHIGFQLKTTIAFISRLYIVVQSFHIRNFEYCFSSSSINSILMTFLGINFQGVDPATDLRGVGLLGLVQALYLVANEETFPLAREIFLLSHDNYSQFPLMVLSINVTRISLQALREGVLNKECNSRGNVRHVLNEFFAAVMFHIFWIWRSEHKTIKESGFLIKEAEAYCKANVRTVLQKLRIHLRRYSTTALESRKSAITS